MGRVRGVTGLQSTWIKVEICINIKIPLNSFNIWMVGSLKSV